jgi:hypothetical protein
MTRDAGAMELRIECKVQSRGSVRHEIQSKQTTCDINLCLGLLLLGLGE